MIWIGNVRGRIKMFDSLVNTISNDRHVRLGQSKIGICGDLILKGDNPVESIMLALNCSSRIVMGVDTYYLFSAMHGNAEAMQYLKYRGGDKLLYAIKPFESLIFDLYNKSELMYRDPEHRVVVTPAVLPKGFNIDVDAKLKVSHILNLTISHNELVKRKDHANLRQLITPALSYDKDYPYQCIDGIHYLNKGMSHLCATADLSESKELEIRTFEVC